MIGKAENISKNHLIIIGLITVISLLPFVNKAFHIDDTVFIWCAKQILLNPMDFYGFSANWYGFQHPMYYINQNPPLVSYYISVISWFFGLSETALHISFIVPATFLSIGICLLASFFGRIPWIASLIAVFTPVFIVSSSNIMSDILMLSFYVWAVVFWLYGLEKDKQKYLLIAGILIAISALTKYFGISLIPLLMVYTLYKRKKLEASWLIYLILPMVILTSYQLLTFYLYKIF